LAWCISGSRAFFVLGRGRGSDDRGIDNRPRPHQQTALLQHRADFREQPSAQIVPLPPMPKIEDRRLVRHRIHRQINPGKTPHRLAVVQGFLHRPVGQCVPVLQKVTRTIRSNGTGGRPRSPFG
jgi:hypothetical protein